MELGYEPDNEIKLGFKPYFSYSAKIILIATVYVITARVGQYFSIEPGNITPVWLPSGIMFAFAVIYGPKIWPGVFIGAFMGNAWAYMEFGSWSSFFAALFSGFANGLGDVLCSVGAVVLLKIFSSSLNPFSSNNDFLKFLLFAVCLGPLVSAAFGISSLYMMGFIGSDVVLLSFSTWWLGDSVGVLLIAPVIIAFYYYRAQPLRVDKIEILMFIAIFSIISTLNFLPDLSATNIPNPSYLVIPLFFWLLTRFDMRVTFLFFLVYAAISIIATTHGYGPFVRDSLLTALIDLDMYLFLLSSTAFVIGILLKDKDRLAHKLKEVSEQDELTGIYNRRYFNTELDREISRFRRTNAPFSLIMFDIDHFKRVNDEHGHLVGDIVLRDMTKLISDHLRKADIFARWGGEEFTILLPGTTLKGATTLANHLKDMVEASEFDVVRRLTISIATIEASDQDALSIISKLDSGLYQSKSSGRNKLTTISA